MFILDTNVLSTIMASRPAPPVAAWVAGRPPNLLFTASVCQAEILSGIAVLPEGRRREGLETAARTMFREDFAGRVLPFDSEAAIIYPEPLCRATTRRTTSDHGGPDDRIHCPRK
jgi:toxin FitB